MTLLEIALIVIVLLLWLRNRKLARIYKREVRGHDAAEARLEKENHELRAILADADASLERLSGAGGFQVIGEADLVKQFGLDKKSPLA